MDHRAWRHYDADHSRIYFILSEITPTQYCTHADLTARGGRVQTVGPFHTAAINVHHCSYINSISEH